MNLTRSSGFKLEKLYLDCIDDTGNCFIIYWAKLEFIFMRIFFSGLIFADSKSITNEESTLKKTPRPVINELLFLNNDLFQIRGDWKRTDDSLSLLLFKDAMNNELVWNVHHPKALTEIIYKDSFYKGFGYAETLFLSIKPWNLPIKELRWGRFLSDHFTIIWIHWKGKHPLNKVFCNGVEYNDAIFEEERVIFGGGIFHLMFQEISILRKGKLSNALSKMPWLKIIINRSILNTVETKFKAKTILSRDLKISANGWSLFEIVTWAK
jgi:hypothetical protein